MTKLFPINRHTAEDLARAFGFMTVGEVQALQTIVMDLPDNAQVINVGAGSGTSALAMLEARPDLRGRTWTVDISEGGPLGGMENERIAFAQAGLFGPNQILADSRAAAKAWTRGPVDFVFIDDGHLEPEIRGDILGWLPHVLPGGFIAFHDYGSPHWPDVAVVVDELLSGLETVMQVDTLIVKRVPR